MKLYTITSTPIQARQTPEYNIKALATYEAVIADTLASYKIDGFTMYEVKGYWQGKPETSYKIEIAVEPESVISVGGRINIIESICQELRDLYKQDSVMLTMPDNTVSFI